MASAPSVFRDVYGSHPFHLLTLTAGFALFTYALVTLGPDQLWNPTTWWQSIGVWFAAAIIAHDLILFPVYSLVDRVLVAALRRRPTTITTKTRVPLINYVRVPLLGATLTLLVFLPGIIEQGAVNFHAATGLTQDPYLGRWLLLTAALFGASAVAYAIRLAGVAMKSTVHTHPAS
ncbi:hypothetical protein [Mycolicibacterium rhodesiae]|uniref:Uncharacterized protein n=1 Tax=Mycolicibacterium rhodesiae TaxID=36814 RepID=A0A1X0ILE9_MYCRH|nr:hypothetical protein [Mycolicibacterium rhodesiae]MCV7346361.1 hypothetical protein [Mycolicibacterium rhodesiae]ORB48137.1 hypothetical protein BST42_26065 [Mycolicibacterium rhodesiae]